LEIADLLDEVDSITEISAEDSVYKSSFSSSFSTVSFGRRSIR